MLDALDTIARGVGRATDVGLATGSLHARLAKFTGAFTLPTSLDGVSVRANSGGSSIMGDIGFFKSGTVTAPETAATLAFSITGRGFLYLLRAGSSANPVNAVAINMQLIVDGQTIFSAAITQNATGALAVAGTVVGQGGIQVGAGDVAGTLFCPGYLPFGQSVSVNLWWTGATGNNQNIGYEYGAEYQ